MDDAEEFNLTRKALETIGIAADAQNKIFAILAGLLHIGNIQITATRTDAVLSSTDAALAKAAALLGIEAASFAKWTTKETDRDEIGENCFVS